MELLVGDSALVLQKYGDNEFDSLVTDPPYGLGFMGKDWDKTLPNLAVWKECYRVMKPGAHGVVFGAPRLYHRLACQLEDVGFEIRDTLMWIYGSGMPKALNLKGEFEGWSTGLKPGYEPVALIRKPLDGTAEANMRKWGVGALHIEASRVPLDEEEGGVGRWPTNVIHDGSEEVVSLFPASRGQQGDVRGTEPSRTGQAVCYGEYGQRVPFKKREDGGGSAARFFYAAKASKRERELGLEGFPKIKGRANYHPTVKPVMLMEYLVKLVTPEGGLVLDPFMGSGTSGIAAAANGYRFVGVDMEPAYVDIARARIEAAMKQADSAR